MIIGVDASRAFVRERTGTENYSYKLLEALGKIDSRNRYIVYTRTFKGSTLKGKQFGWRKIGWPRLWTQGGLAGRSWCDPLDVLFVPAHTLPALRRPGLPTVVTLHGLEYEYLPEYYQFPQKLYLTWSTRYAVKSSTRIIAVSEFTASELVSRLKADPRKIRVIHEGVDTQVYSKSYSDREKHIVLEKLGIRKPYLLFVGLVQPRKNLVRLIEAFSRLVKKNISKISKDKITPNVLSDARSSVVSDEWKDICLVIAGKLGWMYEEILAAPERFGVKDRVVFTGYVEDKDLPILLKEAGVLVQPSLTEGFGLPVLEAMAAGTPVAAARAGALPEVGGDAAVYFDPTNVWEMADQIIRVLAGEKLRQELRKKGLARVKQFTWEKAARETLQVLQEAAQMM